MAEGYDLSGKARADLRDIWIYTQDRWGTPQADRYYRDIITAIERLAAGDLRGRKANIREGYLKYPVGRHVLYCVKGEDRLRIIRVLHQSMDVDRHL